MPLLTPQFKLVINAGGRINIGIFVLTRDKININQSADDNAFNNGDACFMLSSSLEPAFSLGTLGNTIVDDDLID
ncbi:MAG: hypothetical protein PHU36_00060 [Syntrophomonadaceae bacterium]|nr:hypothetical protein [Syntrophomonadaceae bacterium]